MSHERIVLESVLSRYADNYVNVSETDQEREKTDNEARELIAFLGNNNGLYWQFYQVQKKELE